MQLEDLSRRVRAIFDAHDEAARAAEAAYTGALDQLAADPGYKALNAAQPDLVGAVFRAYMRRMQAEDGLK